MPLFKLQYVGGTLRPFLYAHRLKDDAVILGSGVPYCLRQFHTLITGLARDRWIAMVRQLRDNLYLVGQAEDIERFIFGAGREPIRQHLDLLTELQLGRCLYCQHSLEQARAHVDHFVPWMLHRCDTLPNLVAAHAACNLSKGDRLAAEFHLHAWAERNRRGHEALAVFQGPGADRSLLLVRSIALWAYSRAFQLAIPAWVRGREVRLVTGHY